MRINSKWEVKKLGEICEIVNGGTPKTNVKEYWNGTNLWITPAEMGKRETPFVEKTVRQLSDSGLKNSSEKLLPPYSVILSSRAPIGHLVINTKPMATNQGCKGLIPSSKLFYLFLYYYLYFSVDYLNILGTGTTFKELSTWKLKEVEIPFPLLSEQKKIVARLDKFSENIKRLEGTARKNLQNAKDLFSSVLNETFKGKSVIDNDDRQIYKKAQWEVKKLREVCDIELGKTPYRGNASFWDKDKNTKNVWLSIADLLNAQNKIILDSKEYISNKGTNISKIVKKGTLLLSFKLTLGRLAFAGKDLYTNEAIAALGIKCDKILKEYLYYYFSVFDWDSLVTGDVKVKGKTLNKKKLNEINVCYPAISEQKKIVTKLDKLSAETKKLEIVYQKKIDGLTELKKSVLKQTFDCV